MTIKEIYNYLTTQLTAQIIGALSSLSTTSKTTIVGAINEVNGKLPTASSKMISTDATGTLVAIYDPMDINSSTTETALVAADWSTNIASVTGVAGTEVHGADYLFKCTGTNTWRRIAWNLTVNDLYLPPIDDTAGVKTGTQMNSAYPSVIQGQRVRGMNGSYEYFGATFGWIYRAFTKI